MDGRLPSRPDEHRRRDATQLKQPLLLALDLSSTVGWCLMRRHEVPKFGTLPLTGSIITRIGSYHQWLATMLDTVQPDGIAWEDLIKRPSDTVDKLKILYGLFGVTAGMAVARKLPCYQVLITSAKKALTGNSYADKDLMVHGAMSHMKWQVEDHHQADAGAVGLVAYDNLWQK